MRTTERAGYDETYTERGTTRAWDASIVFRVIAVIAAGVLTVIGLIAVARTSWGDGFDAAPVEVAGITFTPEVAVATAVAGLLALVAAALADRASKLVMGAILVCAGIVIIATDTVGEPDWAFEDGLGWLAVAVGGVLVAVAVLMQAIWTTGRRVSGRHPVSY